MKPRKLAVATMLVLMLWPVGQVVAGTSTSGNSNAIYVTTTVSNGPPTDIGLSNDSVAENQPSGTAVGTLSTTDPDPGDTHTYTLAAGVGSDDNASFTIDGSTLKTAVSFDYETKNSYTVRVETDDGDGGTYEEAFTINVSNVNDSPVNNVPGTQNTGVNTPLVFSSANGNPISFSDVDAGGGSIQVILNVTDGTLTLNWTAGLIFTVGDGIFDSTMVFTGAIDSINAALNWMVFQPSHDFMGVATIEITSDDQGLTGPGGPKTDTDTLDILVPATPKLSISKVDRHDPWYVGQKLGYDIYVTNTGNIPLTGVVITDYIPLPWTYLLGEDFGSPYKTWDVGVLEIGELLHLEVEIASLTNTPPDTVITNTVEGMAAELGARVVYTETTLLIEPPLPPTATPTATPTETPTPSPTATSVIPGDPTPDVTPTTTSTPPAVGGIVGAVWNDEDGDTGWDLEENGIEGVGIELWAAEGGEGVIPTAGSDGEPLRTTFTDTAGYYGFEDVPVGNYVVKEIDPEGYVSTTVNEVIVTVLEGETDEASFGDRVGGYHLYLPSIVKLAVF